MLIVFLLFGLFVYFFLMLVCMVISILTAKHMFTWFAYGIGAIYQLIKLATKQEIVFIGPPSAFVWVISALILAATPAVILLWRRPKKEQRRPY